MVWLVVGMAASHAQGLCEVLDSVLQHHSDLEKQRFLAPSLLLAAAERWSDHC
jgi:hypothetical protein